MRFARLFSVLCVSLLVALSARAETAGQVLTAIGEAHALRAGRILQLYPGAPIESGDQVHTGVDSYLQIRFTDWSLISLRPRTDFVVDQYVYEANKGGRQKAYFSLMNGGIRSVTGLIGHSDRGNYRLRTQTATIGIRGTHYGVLMCKEDCRNADGSPGPDGLYGGVVDGRIAVSPYGGGALEREFGAGEYFRLDSKTSIPVPLLAPPQFFWDKREPQVRSGNRHFAGTPWGGSAGETPGPHDTTRPAGTIGGATGVVGSLLPFLPSLPIIPIVLPVPKPNIPPGGPVASTVGPAVGTVVTPVVTPITSTVGSVVAPVTSTVGSTVGSVVTPVVTPVTSTVGSTVGSVVTPVVTPITSTVGSTVGSVVTPVVAPITSTVGSTVGSVVTPVLTPVTSTVGSVVTPVIAPVTSTVGSVVNPVVAPVAPVVAPVIAPVAPVVAPVIAPVAPVIAPVVTPVVAPVVPVIAPVVTPIVAPVAPVIAPIAPVIAPIAPVIAPVIAPSTPTVSLPRVPSLPVTGGSTSLLPKR